MPTIKFTDITGEVPEIFYPTPAKVSIPEWIKNLRPYFSDEEEEKSLKFKIFGTGTTNQTAKRCIPMLDAVMSGYIIYLPQDVKVSEFEGDTYFDWANGLGIGFHDPRQLSTHSVSHSNMKIPKMHNPWSIETPAGYSCLFLPHINSEETTIKPFSGVVDTDMYTAPVNFPFQLQEGFTGVIPAGTPVVQVIPFKREAWKMELNSGSEKKILRNMKSIFSVYRDAYRNMFWSKKDYS